MKLSGKCQFMKTMAFMVMVFSSLTLFSRQDARKTDGIKTIFKGELSTNADEVPGFVVTFQGDRISTDAEGFYSFAVDDFSHKEPYYLLISKHVKPICERDNTIEHFKQIEGKDHLFYALSWTTDENDRQLLTIKPASLTSTNFRIPERCVHVIANPRYVKVVKDWPINLGKGFVKLPRIEFKAHKEIVQNKKASSGKSIKIAKDLHERGSLKSHNYAFDHALFHHESEKTTALRCTGRGCPVVISTS